MEKQMKKGYSLIGSSQIVYTDPITKKNEEGWAYIRKILGNDRYIVEFDNGDKVERTIMGLTTSIKK